MNEFIFHGLYVTTFCRFFQILPGLVNSVREDSSSSLLTITYQEGSTSKEVSEATGIRLVTSGTELMTSSGKVREIPTTIISLNGLRLKKLPIENHIINIIIVEDSESRVAQDELGTTIVVSNEDYKNPEFLQYLFMSGNLVYLKPVSRIPENYEIRNFPKIIIKDKPLELTSKSYKPFYLRRRYDDYVIRSIDYQNQFILEIERILKDYGVELVRQNKERTLTSTSYATYQFNQTPVRVTHVRSIHPDSKIISYKLPVTFTLSSPDMVRYFDFKTKYLNVDLLTNFCEFKTSDKYGDRWSASIKWGQITEDMNHQYMPDSNSNFAQSCQFQAEIFFSEVIDDRYDFLKEIGYKLEAVDKI